MAVVVTLGLLIAACGDSDERVAELEQALAEATATTPTTSPPSTTTTTEPPTIKALPDGKPNYLAPDCNLNGTPMDDPIIDPTGMTASELRAEAVEACELFGITMDPKEINLCNVAPWEPECEGAERPTTIDRATEDELRIRDYLLYYLDEGIPFGVAFYDAAIAQDTEAVLAACKDWANWLDDERLDMLTMVNLVQGTDFEESMNHLNRANTNFELAAATCQTGDLMRTVDYMGAGSDSFERATEAIPSR